MPRNRFELSEVTARLVAYLRSHEKGAVIGYQELAQAIGQPCSPKTTTYARKILQRDHNAVWVCVQPGVGLRRLNDQEIAERLPHWWLRGARNKLSRGGNQAQVVDTQQLNIDQQARFGVDSLQRSLALDALSKTMRQRVEKVARGTSNDLPSFTALEWAVSLTATTRPK